MDILEAWKVLAATALALPAHHSVHVERGTVPPPEESGFYRSIGLNLRASRHYRHRLADGRGLHIQVFRDHYRLHWDRVDPSHSLLGHFLEDVTRAILRPLQGAAKPRPRHAPTEPQANPI